MKKKNVIEFTRPIVKKPVSSLKSSTDIKEELKRAIQELIQRMRLGEIKQ